MKVQVGTPISKHGIKFDSLWECEVYEFLLKYFEPNEIRVHMDVGLYKSTDKMKALSLNVDFYLPTQDLYIEAKGDIRSVINNSFKVKCHILHRVFPHALERLIVIDPQGNNSLPWKNGKTVSLHHLKNLFSKIGIERIS